MNILFILEHYYPNIGGVERMFSNLAEQLASEGHRVRVVTTLLKKDLPLLENRKGVEIIRIKLHNRFLFSLFGIFFFFKHTKGFDLIHTTSYNAAWPAFLASFLRGKPAIITFHEYWNKLWFKLPYLLPYAQKCYWLYEQIIVSLPFKYFIGVSDFTKHKLQKRRKNAKVIRIYNGLETNELAKRENCGTNDTFTFTYFGRLGVSKGLDLILKATQLLKNEKIDFRLKLIVPRVPASLLKLVSQIIEQEGIASIISLQHELTDEELQSQLNLSDCILIPSYSEGFCFAAAECSAMGHPYIHSGKGALSEVASGKTIRMNDFSAIGLSEAMKKAMNGEWEYSEIRNFPLKKQVAEYMSLYKEICK